MTFAEFEIADAEGAILAHSVKLGNQVIKKGHRLTKADLSLFASQGVKRVFAARLDPDDVGEDEAAGLVAAAIAGPGTVVHEASTGRANIYARNAGVAVIDADRLNSLNRLHESLTIATLPPFGTAAERQMVATVKIIPFAVPRAIVTKAAAIAGEGSLVTVRSYVPQRAGLVITRLPQTKLSLIDKSRDGVRSRLEALGSTLGDVMIVDHAIEAVSAAVRRLATDGHDPVLVFGASAIVDRGDVIPASLVAAGGSIIHLGMPVDPGNLLMYGTLAATRVIGVPSCARSPKVNGFDWVLQRTLAGISLAPHDIMDMGVGGLLMEIPSRPLPRERALKVKKTGHHVAAIVLAAGRSTRMGSNKLLKAIHGKPMIRRTVENVLQSRASPVYVVTGHDEKAVRDALVGLDVAFVTNPLYSDGLSTSLKAGIDRLPDTVDGALIVLGDMPLVPVASMNKLIASFEPAENRSICVPVFQGERGNPILWGRQHFADFEGIKGDGGAKVLLVVNSDNVTEVHVRSDGVLTDFDTPDSLNAVK